MALPGIIATGILTFIRPERLFFARILISSDNLKTLPVGIADLYNASVIDWGMIAASGPWSSFPSSLSSLCAEILVAGWGSGGVKG
jgi:multiple sugar transport system permease protein